MNNAYQQPPATPPSNGLGVAGFVCSLLGILTTCGLLSPIGLIFSLIALRKEPRGLAIAGTIIGAFGSIGFIIFFLIFGFMLMGLLAVAGAGVALTLPNIQTAGNMLEMHNQIDQYHSTLGSLPESVDTITTLKPDLKLDAWNNPIRYEITGTNSYELQSAGPDGKWNTADDIELPFTAGN